MLRRHGGLSLLTGFSRPFTRSPHAIEASLAWHLVLESNGRSSASGWQDSKSAVRFPALSFHELFLTSPNTLCRICPLAWPWPGLGPVRGSTPIPVHCPRPPARLPACLSIRPTLQPREQHQATGQSIHASAPTRACRCEGTGPGSRGGGGRERHTAEAVEQGDCCIGSVVYSELSGIEAGLRDGRTRRACCCLRRAPCYSFAALLLIDRAGLGSLTSSVALINT